MKITEKHRIKYKRKDSPSKPVEMAIFRDEEGDYLSTTGDIVAYDDGTPSWWVNRMLDGTSRYFVGEIIPPPTEPKLGMVVRNLKDHDDYYVCVNANTEYEYIWADDSGGLYSSRLFEDGNWEVVPCSD